MLFVILYNKKGGHVNPLFKVRTENGTVSHLGCNRQDLTVGFNDMRFGSAADQLDFSRNFSVARPAYLGNTIFPDIKTQNF